jgi:two-component system NtrC family sensor kinase
VDIRKTIEMKVSQRWWISLPFLIALAVLIFLGWSVLHELAYPYDGILILDPTGIVQELDPSGPTYGQLDEGDVILFIDGKTVQEAQPLYGDKRPDDIVNLNILRDGVTEEIAFRLGVPTLEERVTRLTPLIVALVFWGIGVGIQAFKPASEATGLYFVFFQAAAVFLIAGGSSFTGPPWIAALLGFLLWIIGPLLVHFHFYFPQRTIFPGHKILILVLYTMALIGGLPYLIWGPQAVQAGPLFPQYQFANRIFLAVNFLLAVALLFYAYQHAITPGVRGKIRIVVLGGAISLLPLVTLVILPDALLDQPILPLATLILFLGILPLTYGYAIFRHRLIEVERHVNRGATFILVYSILGGFYLILYVILENLLPEGFAQTAVINTALVLILATVFVPLRSRIQRIVDSVFYGGWYDYRFAISQITQGLEQITDLETLATTVSERLVRTIRLEESCVFLSDINGDFSILAVAPKPGMNDGTHMSFIPLPRSSLSYLLKMGGAVERSSLRQTLTEIELSPEEYELLTSEQVHLWVPIIGHGRIMGLLALGPKLGGDIFSGEDVDILRVVSRQMGPLIENIHLVTSLKRHASDLERRVAERTEELYAEKERVEAILASVGEGVVVIDLEGNFITVNAAYEEQSGFREVELIGQKAWDYYQGEEVENLMDNIRDVLQIEHVWNGELVGIRKNGNPYDVQLTVTPLRDEYNRIVGYVGSQRDVTQQKELDRLKDLFVSDVSHELRTPTTNIGLYLELLEGAPPAKRTEYIAVLKEQSKLLVKLVEDILDLSRLTIGKEKGIEFTQVDLNMLTDRVVAAHRPLAEAAGLTLEFNPDNNLLPVWGEQNQLARLVNNLVSNAIRYTEEGGVFISTTQADDHICLKVSDTGMGIDPEDEPHLFERFYRGRRVRQTKVHGTGLGLAIVKEIVDLHDSKIEVKSEIGGGSDFIISFPIRVSELWLEKQY